MAHPSDVLIGLHAGISEVRAVAFDHAGRQLGIAAASLGASRLPDGGVEQDMAEAWQAAARAMRLLAQRVPDLGRRTVALSITGQAGGSWLIDEDGDPVGAALLGPDARAAAIVADWARSPAGPAVVEITGTALSASLQSAQLAWLQRHRPQLIEAAASVLHVKDWFYFCCTGERATDPCEAVAAYGDPRRGTYDPGVLELLELHEAARLLPEIVDGIRHQGALLPAAAAATGLYEGTPVVLAPPEPVSAALAAGLPGAAADCGCSVLGPVPVHMRWGPQMARLPAAGPAASIVPVGGGEGFCELATPALTTPGIDWLAGIGEQLLADLGLIGISGDELAALLERKAGDAEPGALLFASSAEPHVRRQHVGLSDRTSFYDLMRAVYEALGFAARAGYQALGYRPKEVRLAGAGARRPVLRQIVAACVGAPTRTLGREDAAAAGAAQFAATALGQYRSLSEGSAHWVEPYLEAAEPLDQALGSVYELLLELHRPRRRQPEEPG